MQLRMQLCFGYGLESCDANGPRNVKNTSAAKHRPVFLPRLLFVGSNELVLKVPKQSGAKKKGVLAKGVSVESSVTSKETKNTPRRLGPAVRLALRAPQPRKAYIFVKTPF